MRAICESCNDVQPVDWLAGDLCVHCSGPVRREERCFWCNAWGPAGGFCRECGAEQVAVEHYGAARMLTQTGADMFAIPKLIREMDPGRLAVFADKYARQRALVARHVDDLLYVESFCLHRGFARALEESWVAQLPFADVSGLATVDGPSRLRALEECSPVDDTRALASIARLWSRDWSASKAVWQLVRRDDAIGHEAALALTWWRAATVLRLDRFRAPLKELARIDMPAQVAVRLGFFGRPFDTEALVTARLSGDADLAFAAALADGNVTELSAALTSSDLDMQFAAARELASRGHVAALTAWFPSVSPQLRGLIVRDIAHDDGHTAGPLVDAILALMAATDDDDVVSNCGRLLARGCSGDLAMRIAELSRGEIYVVQALMGAALEPIEMARVGATLARHNWLSHNKYGVEDAARRGAFPDDFVAGVFDSVDSDQAKVELCRFAENQLYGRDIEVVHAFLMRTVFGPYSHVVRAAAWWGLSRWYAQDRYGSMGPLELTPESITRFFPDVGAFLSGFTAVLRDFDTLKEVGVFDFLHHLVHGLTPERAQMLSTFEAHRSFVDAMSSAAELDIWSPLRDSLKRAVSLFAEVKAA